MLGIVLDDEKKKCELRSTTKHIFNNLFILRKMLLNSIFLHTFNAFFIINVFYSF